MLLPAGYSTEEANSILTQICCSRFGNGMAGLVPGSGIGVKPTVSCQYSDLSAQSRPVCAPFQLNGGCE